RGIVIRGDGGQRKRLQGFIAFPHFVFRISSDRPFEDLNQIAAGPSDLDLIDARSFAQSYMRAQARCPETAAAIDGAINVTALAVFRDMNANPCADGKSIGTDAMKAELDPMVAMPRIFENHRPKSVGRENAADLLQNILVSIVVDVRKGHSVAFL